MFLEDILTSMDRIAEYIEGLSYDQFKKYYKTVDAVIRNFEIIGEAANKIPQSVKEMYKEVPWSEMYLLRNKVSHEYFGIDYEILWDVIINHLPTNRIQILEIINSLLP
jgi:uncharacterized protein with HEPN domain